MAPHFLIPLHLQWGNPLWPLWEAGEWRGEQQWPPEHQGGAEPLQQREHSLLFPVLCSIYKKKPNSQRAKKKMTTQVFSGTPTQNTKSLNCLSLLPHFWICLYLHNAAWSMIWRCGTNESCLELRVSCVFYVCLISRTRCESEQWACGICSVLSGCPPTADRHQRWPGCCRHTGSQTGTSSSKRQRNKTLHSSPAVFVGQNNVKISSSCI